MNIADIDNFVYKRAILPFFFKHGVLDDTMAVHISRDLFKGASCCMAIGAFVRIIDSCLVDQAGHYAVEPSALLHALVWIILARLFFSAYKSIERSRLQGRSNILNNINVPKVRLFVLGTTCIYLFNFLDKSTGMNAFPVFGYGLAAAGLYVESGRIIPGNKVLNPWKFETI